MPKAKRESSLYRRGDYWLDWDRRADGTHRTPFLTVFWYDSRRRRVRSASTRETELEAGKAWLDRFYLDRSRGVPATQSSKRGHLVTAAIADYLTGTVPGKPSENAIRARLDHVLDYIEDDDQADICCEEVDQQWIERFRAWSAKQPVVSTAGNIIRNRSLSTTENSVIQLSAAIHDAKRRRNTPYPPAFRSTPIKLLNRSPEHRSDIDELAAMFRYCVRPDKPTEKRRARAVNERQALHRFLIVSVASLARPDAAYDVNTLPKRRQWNSKARILNLNPAGRRQTKKYRATVKLAWQAALHLDNAPKGYFVGPSSVRSAWDAMAAELGLPGEGEAGQKLIRRSMGHLLRQRRVPREEVEMMMGHRPYDSTTEIYAPFEPDYLAGAVAAIEAIIDEIEALCPGAFALPDSNVVTLGRKA